MDHAIAVIDIGKTRSKLTLWSNEGVLLRQLDRVNARPVDDELPQLDLAGIGAWLMAGLDNFASGADIAALVPVGHGAAAVLMDGETPIAALDYEAPIPEAVAAAYDFERDPFEATLSPRLEGGLNLGAQLFWLEQLYPEFWPGEGRVLLWPQYWAWVLSGRIACEVTSLGCHSDLWRPLERRFSDLAQRRGWAGRLGPLMGAGEVLGPVRRAVSEATGISADCRVYCGLHDSNAALHAARGLGELGGRAFSVVSTGTWFICMGAGGSGPAAYNPGEDMLANIDIAGTPTPTARFMGGRDYETWMGRALGATSKVELLEQAAGLADWTGATPALRATRAALELARRADHALTLIAAQGPILIEGRFAADEAFSAALAALRPRQSLYRSPLADGVALGALRLAAGDAVALPPLERITRAG
ncbi:MAG: carbohydrate kinase [Caulobacterales bacterium]